MDVESSLQLSEMLSESFRQDLVLIEGDFLWFEVYLQCYTYLKFSQDDFHSSFVVFDMLSQKYLAGLFPLEFSVFHLITNGPRLGVYPSSLDPYHPNQLHL